MLRLPSKLLLAAVVLTLVYGYGLTRTGLVGPDEPRYAAIGRDMAASGDWVTPRLWGETWFEKPALLYWLVGVGHVAGLPGELAPRVPVVAVSLAFLLFYFLQLRREWGERAAWYATAMLSTSAGWLAFSHVAVTDLPLAATYSAAMLLSLRWVRSGGRRGLIFAGMLLGLAVLAKGLVPLVLAAPLAWVGRKRWRDLLLLASSCVLVAAPWYVLCWRANGSEFVDEFIWRHHFGRFISSELQHVQPWWFYVPVLLGLLVPWTPALVMLRRVDLRDPRKQLLAGCALFGFLFFSVSTNKLPGYVLPLLPLLIALIAVEASARQWPRWVPPAGAALIALTPAVAATVPEALAHGLRDAGLTAGSLAGTAGMLAAAVGVAVLEGRGQRDIAFGTAASLALASVLFLKVEMFPHLDAAASARPLWEQSKPDCAANISRSLRYGLQYYAGRELPDCTASRQ